MRQHSELGASVAHRWMACPGSVRLSRGRPNLGSRYADEGTAAHWLAERALTEFMDPVHWLGQFVPVGESSVEVTEEMVEVVGLYVSLVKSHANHSGHILQVEKRFSLANLGEPEMFGTADAVVFARPERRLYVDDLKYGSGVVVEVDDNEQLLYYALGALLEIEWAIGPGKIDDIMVTIVQPRAWHPAGAVRSFIVTYSELVDFAQVLLEKADATRQPDAPLVAGSWCHFCPAAAICPALHAKSQEVAQIEFGVAMVTAPPPPSPLTPAEVANVLAHKPLIEKWLAAVEAWAHGELQAGRPVPGFKLVEKRAIRKWVSEEAALSFIAKEGLKPEEYLDTKLKSVAQIEKVVGKGAIPAEIVVKQSSGANVVPDWNPRPAIAAGPDAEFAIAPPAVAEEPTS